MHADLVKLLDLQAKDSAVAEVERRLDALQGETGVLDQALERAREGLEAATRAAGLAGLPRAVLFSRRRFKQRGARYASPLHAAEEARWTRPTAGS